MLTQLEQDAMHVQLDTCVERVKLQQIHHMLYVLLDITVLLYLVQLFRGLALQESMEHLKQLQQKVQDVLIAQLVTIAREVQLHQFHAQKELTVQELNLLQIYALEVNITNIN